MLRWREGGRGSQEHWLTVNKSYEEVVVIKNQKLASMGKIAYNPETLSKLRDSYLKYCEHQKSHYDKKLLSKAILDKFGDIPPASLNIMAMEQYQTELLAKYKVATVNRYFACLKHMISKAVDWRMADESVLRDVRKIKCLKENNRRLRYLSKEEAEALLKCCRESQAAAYLYPIVQLALNTGMRQGEILSLRWDNVDMKAGYIHVVDTKNGERRSIPINDTLRAAFKPIPVKIDGGRVFDTQLAGDSFHTALRRAGIRNFKFHDLRHTFASWLAMGGCDLTTLKELLGHKSIAMTLRYAHLSGEHKKQAVKILDAPCVVCVVEKTSEAQ